MLQRNSALLYHFSASPIGLLCFRIDILMYVLLLKVLKKINKNNPNSRQVLDIGEFLAGLRKCDKKMQLLDNIYKTPNEGCISLKSKMPPALVQGNRSAMRDGGFSSLYAMLTL